MKVVCHVHASLHTLQTFPLCVMEYTQQGKRHSFLSSARIPNTTLPTEAQSLQPLKNNFDAFPSGRDPFSYISQCTTFCKMSLLCQATLSAPVQPSTGMQMPLRQPDLPLFTALANVVSQFSNNTTRHGKIKAAVQSRQNTATFVLTQ